MLVQKGHTESDTPDFISDSLTGTVSSTLLVLIKLLPDIFPRKPPTFTNREEGNGESDTPSAKTRTVLGFPVRRALVSGAVRWRSAHREAMKSGKGHSSPGEKPRNV